MPSPETVLVRTRYPGAPGGREMVANPVIEVMRYRDGGEGAAEEQPVRPIPTHRGREVRLGVAQHIPQGEVIGTTEGRPGAEYCAATKRCASQP